MDFKALVELFGKYPAGYIKFKAGQVVEGMGLPRHDIEDVEQELITYLLEKKPDWAEEKCTWNSFAKMVIDQKISILIKEWTAQKRDYRLVRDPTLNDSDGCKDWQDLIEDGYMERALNQGARTRSLPEMKIDVQQFKASLPKDVQPFASALGVFNGYETARVLGVCISTVYRYKCLIRKQMIRSGLEKYFQFA